MSEQLGEVEIKIKELVDETFAKYTSNTSMQDDGPTLNKENIKDFIQSIMKEAGEEDAWDEEEFNLTYKEIDNDGDEKITRSELQNIVQRLAAL